MGLFFVLLYLIALYVRPQDWVAGFIGFPTGFVILMPALAVAIAKYIPQRMNLRVPQYKLLLAYLVVIFVSTLVSVDIGRALDQTNVFAKRVAVFFVIAWSLTTERQIRIVVGTVLLLSLFLAFQAILQAQTGESWGGMTPTPGYTEIRVRWHGDWDGPNVFAILFIIAMGIVLELVFGTYGFVVRLLGLSFAGTYITAIFLTNSRGAILAVAAMVAFYFRSRFKSIKAILLAAICLAGLFALGPSRMSEVSSKESSAHERTWLWEQGLALLKQNPIFGVGRGEFSHRVDLGLIAHNNYVQSFTELGLSGFFLFAAIFWFCFKGANLVSSSGAAGNGKLAPYGRMLTAVMVGYAVATFFVVMELDLYYFVLGLATAIYLVSRQVDPNIPILELNKTETIVVASGMAVIIGMIWVAAVLQIL